MRDRWTAPCFSLLTALLMTACPACSPAEGETASRATQQRQGAQAAATPGPSFVPAPPDVAVDALVRAELARLEHQAEARLIVYVGASWCEPCRFFHEAVESGALDSSFPGLRMLEFDLDEDRARLAAAGYSSRLIPLFALPLATGRASAHSIQGGVKGPAAVDNLRLRLEELLARAP